MEEELLQHKCTLCQSVLETQDALSNHYQEQHQSVYFACYLCPRSFKTLNQTFLHLNNEHNTVNPDRTKIALYDYAIKARGTVRRGYVQGEPLPLPQNKRNLWSNQKCTVDDCASNADTVPPVKLFRFPAIDINQRYLWVAILNKKN